jgi:hypothetical protein
MVGFLFNGKGGVVMRNILILVPAFLLLASCGVVTSDIVPAGKDTYFMSSRGYAVASGGAFAEAYKKADEYCKKEGKFFAPVSANSEKIDIMSSDVGLTFRCLNENDPEYTRPDMDSVYPKQRIEIEHK